MNFQEELKRVEFAMKSAVGGGSATHVAHCDNIFPYFICWCEVLAPLAEMQAAKQLGSGAAKRNCHCEAESSKGISKIFEYSLSQSRSIKKLASFILIKEFEKLLSLTKWKLFIFSPLGGGD